MQLCHIKDLAPGSLTFGGEGMGLIKCSLPWQGVRSTLKRNMSGQRLQRALLRERLGEAGRSRKASLGQSPVNEGAGWAECRGLRQESEGAARGWGGKWGAPDVS